MKVILSGYLLINAWTDWKRREIDLCYTVVFIIIGILYTYAVKGSYSEIGILPGFILLLFSFVWRNHIGMGDGIVVMAFGWLCGLKLVCDVLVGGFVLATIVGVVCCVWKKSANIELPFVPFLLGSYLLELWV